MENEPTTVENYTPKAMSKSEIALLVLAVSLVLLALGSIAFGDSVWLSEQYTHAPAEPSGMSGEVSGF